VQTPTLKLPGVLASAVHVVGMKFGCIDTTDAPVQLPDEAKFANVTDAPAHELMTKLPV
jgi:hypothetical protein